MNFTPRSAKEIAEAGLLPKGEYDFEVIRSENKVSKKGNDMIQVKLKVFHGASTPFIDDYLLASMEAKLRHFCEATGLLEKYESGALTAEDCLGRVGKVKIIVHEDKTGEYDPKNSVKDYVVKKAKKDFDESEIPNKTQDENGDDIPF